MKVNKSYYKNLFKFIFIMFPFIFIYIGAILLIFAGFDKTMWLAYLYTIKYFTLYILPIFIILILLFKNNKTSEQAILMNQISVPMYPYSYQDLGNYYSIVNGFLCLVNIVFGLFFIIGSIFISGDTRIIIIESIWALFIIFLSIKYLKKYKLVALLRLVFLNLF